MLEIERILENKPVRPPVISTLQMRGNLLDIIYKNFSDASHV